MTRAYLDHASSSPLRPEALEATTRVLRDVYGDPGRLHDEGRVSRVALEQAREEVAAFVDARPREVVFCGSGTEAINFGHWWLPRDAHVVTSAVEHSAVRDALARTGAEVTVVGVDRLGRVDADAVVAAVRDDTALVSVQLANHEVPTVQRVERIAAAMRERGRNGMRVHVDACAAIGHLPLSFRELDVDLCSITGHKLGGPAGGAALLVRRGTRIEPLLVGGAQERARRGGYEDVAACAGFGAACAVVDVDIEAAAARALTESIRAAARTVDGVEELGDTSLAGSLPHMVCLRVEGVEAEPILLGLNQRGVAVHSGSACASEMWEPSPVLLAMGVDAQHSLRVSVGWSSTAADIDHFAEAFAEVVTRLRQLRT
ncbi:MAG TPA: aminotransferase class V-fold PLP-dependent enzyme [Acidimicrobiia bacterium]